MKMYRTLRVEGLESRELLAGTDLAAVSGGTAEVHTASARFAHQAGIVSEIVKAPVASDGNVAGAATDLVINLDASLDPAVEGRTLLKGKTIKVILPDDFVDSGVFPVQDVFSEPTCAPNNIQCNTGLLVQGWPQRPVFPQNPPGSSNGIYSVSLEGTNTIVYTALADIVPGTSPPGPGIKQLHLLLEGFVNPDPGMYQFQVVAETGPGGALETGTGRVRILRHIRPSIQVTTPPPGTNTIYQSAAPGELVPLPYDFLLWGRDGVPLTDVEIHQFSKNRAWMRQDGKIVGSVHIKAPLRAHGQEIFSQGPSFLTTAPLTGFPTARLTAGFRVGSKAGDYVVTFNLFGGTSQQMFVHVESPASNRIGTECLPASLARRAETQADTSANQARSAPGIHLVTAAPSEPLPVAVDHVMEQVIGDERGRSTPLLHRIPSLDEHIRSLLNSGASEE